ncbi:disulfide bond formation protein B [Endozoicomonas sp. Mp262]|uniref:disulfide bond formation protein B n=1 Tax=Endozoicomonas sp. Mp262 TaxID=2919499 RepID=UPI0021D7EBC4
MTRLTSRVLFLLAALSCAGLIGFALFLQHIEGLEPCPLCISQRIVVIAIGLAALVATIHNPGHLGYKIYGVLTSLLGASGMALASRQIWIQHLPPEQVPSCMPGVEYLVDILPLTEFVKIMLTGTGDCAEIQWTFLGLTIPGWTLLTFAGFTVFGIYEIFRKRRRV